MTGLFCQSWRLHGSSENQVKPEAEQDPQLRTRNFHHRGHQDHGGTKV